MNALWLETRRGIGQQLSRIERVSIARARSKIRVGLEVPVATRGERDSRAGAIQHYSCAGGVGCPNAERSATGRQTLRSRIFCFLFAAVLGQRVLCASRVLLRLRVRNT